ncbi:MAG: DUF2304 domain-containing protein [Chloroflexi bacterium]|nr:DUF2304 domain-containing protein [Chloroflexota bacterium]
MIEMVVGMSLRARLVLLALGMGTGLVVLNLVRTRRLKEEFSLLWLSAALLLVLAPLASDLFDALAVVLGIDYSPNLIFALAFMVVLLLLLQFSTTLSRFSDQIKSLAQAVALLTRRVEELEGQLEQARGQAREGGD